MISAKTSLPPFALVALFSAVIPIFALPQESAIPPRPDSRIHDAGSIFEAGERREISSEIEKKLEALQAETGCDVLIATVTSTTGTSPRALVDQLAGAWLNPQQNGAVLLFERTGHRFAISATAPANDFIADYIFSSIEQTAAEGREDASPAESVALAASDLTALFRKSFGSDAARKHPAIRADWILMAVVAAIVVAMTAVVATVQWRGERARA